MRAFIYWGGWDGHDPELVANRFKQILENEGFEVVLMQNKKDEEGHCPLPKEEEFYKSFDLIVPVDTGGNLPGDRSRAICHAVASGVGIAGCHGGMCDAYRNDTEWQFMTGGQWVSHPGGDGMEYAVNIRRGSSPIIDGLEDFPVKSEHYYLHVDPSIEVLATTRFPLKAAVYMHASNKPIDMPVVWTKYWGVGRVFYSSLGHHDDVFDKSPTAQEIQRRGMLWAAAGKAENERNGFTVEKYENSAKMY
ncbi:MAG: ThuA domain-containing protein [Oscillospiraceae bacterium]|jgi:type 1 glutamine amidotransferase|nr:ThuA domain-containing protein [Oscillospiraceae bacterium]